MNYERKGSVLSLKPKMYAHNFSWSQYCKTSRLVNNGHNGGIFSLKLKKVTKNVSLIGCLKRVKWS